MRDMEEVGSGAFGIVYRAKWRGLNVAVKQIRAEHVTQDQLASFLVIIFDVTVQNDTDKKQGEVALLQRLRPHPNVVLL